MTHQILWSYAPRASTVSIRAQSEQSQSTSNQNCFFNTDTGKAFTTVRAGLALTTVILPNISLLPALVAGFTRVFIMHKPGMMNLPVFLTSLVPISAKPSMIFLHSFGLISLAPDNACAKPPLLNGLAPAFIAFIGAMVLCDRSAGCN